MQQNPVKLKAIILPTTAAGHVAGLGYRRASAGLNKCEFVIFNRMKHPHVYSFPCWFNCYGVVPTCWLVGQDAKPAEQVSAKTL